MGTWEYDESEKKNITVIKKQEWFEDFLNTFLYDSNMSKYLPYWRHTLDLESVQVYNPQINFLPTLWMPVILGSMTLL